MASFTPRRLSSSLGVRWRESVKRERERESERERERERESERESERSVL